MNILFLHPNFPAQFLHLAMHFARDPKNRVFFLTKDMNKNRLKDVTVGIYKPKREATQGIHHYVKPMEEAVLDGQAVVLAMASIREQANFVPDVIVGHTGWGSTLFVKDLYPDVPLLGYFEWYYHAYGSDVGYWPDEAVPEDDRMRIRCMNTTQLLAFQSCDRAFTPTQWQRSQFPELMRERLQVIHEGVDTEFACPQPGRKLVLPKAALDLSEAEEVVTYLSRGFEPYRGFPQFMEAIRILLARRPKCHVVIAGMDRTCYGPSPKGTTWKKLEEEKGGYDKSRVHFTGHLDRESYQMFLQASTVHVYLTRPFILSWSMVEAMSAGCCLVGSKTPPVEEFLEDGVNGLLANFREPSHIALRIEEALEDAALRKRLGKAARETVLEKLDKRDCVRRQVNMIYGAMK